ncbi:unnamed protein product [Cuscuta campestris]|uniref:Integrase zinc-binding domain-containing protein n=1 Tax=Cuscuta campestris TaxID=132261 RepID=A0A484M581_9ASTE|nr:unnamed protein product [Cuscuta campestris]
MSDSSDMPDDEGQRWGEQQQRSRQTSIVIVDPLDRSLATVDRSGGTAATTSNDRWTRCRSIVNSSRGNPLRLWDYGRTKDESNTAASAQSTALPRPSGIRDIPAGQPRQVLRTASSPILQELHDPEEVERERRAIARRRAEELAQNSKVNEDRAKDASRIVGDGNENPRGSVFERISRQKAHVSERLGKNPDKAPQGWIRPQASQVASSNREPQQRNGRGEIQAPVRSVMDLEEDEVQSQARVPAPRRLGPPVPEADASDALMCRCFLQTVDSKVADWVNHIPAGSIWTWDELGLRFLEHFAGNYRPKKHFTHLASDGLLHIDLTTHPPDTFEEAMVQEGRYVTLEERKEEKKEKTPKEEEKTGNKKPFKNKKQGFPDGPKGTSSGTSEKHKSANLVFTLEGILAETQPQARRSGQTWRWSTRCWSQKALGLTRDKLSPIKTPLTGFTGDSIKPEGVITLPVEIGDTKATRKLDMKFVVVGIISSTNIILGRPGLEDLECVISPRHLCIKFPTPHGVGIARGSQRVSQAWYLKATKRPVKYDTQVGEVTAQLLRVEEKRPRVEVAGDIEEVELEPGMPGRLVRIGKGMGDELRSRVISVLRRFRRVFAGSPADMPGLDHKIAVHRLNVLRDAKPVKQKRRHLLQERRDFVKKEAHRIVVLTNEPLASLARSPAASARMTKWAVFISQYNVEFRPRPSMDLLELDLAEQNAEADVLSKLSAESPEYISKLTTVEELATPTLNRNEVIWVSADPPEWLDRLAKYIEDGEALEDPQEARLLRMRAPTYKVQDGILYKQSYNGVLLRCLRAAEAKALMEEIHEGVCAAHQGPYSVSRKAIIQGYFWPTMKKDCEEYVRKCPTCQQFQNMPWRPAMNYTPISSVIPFSRWGIDIVGALPKEANG